MKNLKGKIALVTGASQGIGRGIATELARNGARVVVNYRDAGNLDRAEKVVAEIGELGGEAVAMECDVTDSKAVAALFKKIGEKFGRLDILANNAGTSQPKDIFEITDEDWDRIIKTNLTSGFYCARQAMLMMREKHGYIRSVDIAEQLGVTKSHLVRVFKQEIGIPPGKYMTNVRIEAVKTLLLTDEYNLDMIAGLTGFSGANYLCRVFKREVGLSPAAWRTAAAPLPAVPKLPPRSQEMYV